MKHRLAVILPMHLVLYAICFYVAYHLRFDFELTGDALKSFWASLPVLLIFKLSAGFVTGLWRHSFRYATLNTALSIVTTQVAAATLLFSVNNGVLAEPIVPRSVILIDLGLSILVSGTFHAGARCYTEMILPLFANGLKKRSLIYGTDRAGIGICALQAAESEFQVVGFIEDGKEYHNSSIGGIGVHSPRMGWAQLAARLQATHVLIPSILPGKCVRTIVESCAQAGIKTHLIPAVDELADGRYKLTIRDVTISDLLRRESTQLDLDGIRQRVSSRRVLITGGAGSIGSELCRQILALKPESLTVLDQSEFGIFTIRQELERDPQTHTDLRFVIADVANSRSIERVMEEHLPQLVFHAAAYKHVPLMQEHPQEAIRNNILGTKTVVDLASRFEVEAFVLISTDKAVHPSNIMGATKFIAEKYVQAAATTSKTDFMTVRFGNVLDSAGSVVPTFRQQIAGGGPITVTHPEIERFFMTIPEAVQLVLQAAAIGRTGDLLILEMGEPVKIFDLAKDMIHLSGLKFPDDIEIVFTGLRPGEKLSEELFYHNEVGTRKIHDKIFCASRNGQRLGGIQQDIETLSDAVNGESHEAARTLMQIVSQHIAFDQTPKVTWKIAA